MERKNIISYSLQFFAEDPKTEDEKKIDTEKDPKNGEDGTEKKKNEDTQAFAEGARKERERIFKELGIKDLDTAKSKLGIVTNPTDEKKEDVKKEDLAKKAGAEVDPNESLKKEVQELKAYKVVNDIGVARAYQDDVIAICIGKGLEPNETNLLEIMKKHPDWKVGASDTTKIGSDVGEKDKANPDERSQARSLFGLK